MARILSGTPLELGYVFPPEWHRHRGTWISWPRPEGISFPDRYHQSIEDVIGVIAAITRFEPVHLNVANGNYRRIVLLSQTDDPAVEAAGREAAEMLGLEFEHVHVGRDRFAEAVSVSVQRRVA